ncbi:hypothetical protein PIB30_059608, partial [Stylosanthes scabra]|nr:hypothetical protein [Stylosanthes scabra]
CLEKNMSYFNLTVYHEGIFVHDQPLQYVGAQRTIIEEMDSDWWSMHEAFSELRRLRYQRTNISAFWYKDHAVNLSEENLRLFETGTDAKDMYNIARARNHVEMFVVHEVDNYEEPFPKGGYIDVGDPIVKDDKQVAKKCANGDNNETHAEGSNECANKGAYDGGEQGANEEHNDGRSEAGSDEDSDDEEFLPSPSDIDSADDVYFTDSEDKYDDESGFEEQNDNGDRPLIDKGKGIANAEFNDDGTCDSDDFEKDYEVSGGLGEDDGHGIRYQVYKPQKDMKDYTWQLGTLFASRDEFKEAVVTYAVQNTRGVTFKKCNRKRVRVVCVKGCPF